MIVHILLVLLFCVFNGKLCALERQIYIRDKLFKCDFGNEVFDKEYQDILKRIDLKRHEVPTFALKSIRLTDSRKKSDRDFFIKAIASTTKWINKIIFSQRMFIKYIQNKRQKNIFLSPGEKTRFDMICSFYQSKDINELLLRIAPIPISLSVAQASLESRFGSVEAIHKSNAYFGLAQTKTRLFSFDSLIKSVIAYAKTLNVNSCYREFRRQRADMISKSQKIDGVKLSAFLHMYGTDKNYQNLILRIINHHNLSILDKTGSV